MIVGENNGPVYQGRDGVLFLSGGRHNIFRLFSDKHPPDSASIENFVDNVCHRQRYCAERSSNFKMVVFPDKCVALANLTLEAENLRSVYQEYYEEPVQERAGSSSVTYPINNIRDRLEAFHKTDTHYNAIGNKIVLRDILDGFFPADQITRGLGIIDGCIGRRENYCGDLGAKLSPILTETASILSSKAVPYDLKTNGMVGGNDGICDLVESPKSLSDKTLLIFGDSFFRALLPMLTVYYRRIIFCRTRFFHYEMVEALNPDDILCGAAERYLSNCLSDLDRPHFLSFPLILERELKPTKGYSTLWEKFVDRPSLLKT
mgnify:CR=1 FL=1